MNFNLSPFKWQKEMDIIMENVSLDKIEFTDVNIVTFGFSDIYTGKEYKTLICNNVWRFCHENIIEKDEGFPIFIGDVRMKRLASNRDVVSAFKYLKYGFCIPDGCEYHLVCIDSGDISISLICETASVL